MKGLLICNGPKLEEEWEAARASFPGLRVVVNSAFRRIRWERVLFYISVAPPWHVFKEGALPGGIVPILFNGKQGLDSLRMETDDYPDKLVNPGVTLFCGIHWLVCKGCTHIHAVGLNLENWDDGFYNQGGGKDGKHIFENIRRIWDSYTNRDLFRLGVRFTSSSLVSSPCERIGPV